MPNVKKIVMRRKVKPIENVDIVAIGSETNKTNENKIGNGLGTDGLGTDGLGTDEKSVPSLSQKYIDELDEKTKIAYEIAKHHLESSFDLEKSIGYLEFCRKIQK